MGGIRVGMGGMQYVYIDGVGLGVSWAGQGATCLNEVLDGIGESMGFGWAEEEGGGREGEEEVGWWRGLIGHAEGIALHT